MKSVRVLISLAVIFLCARGYGASGASESFSFEGVLTDSNGTLYNGVKDFKVELRDTSGTIPYWSKTYSSVSVQNGNFKLSIDNTGNFPTTPFVSLAAVFQQTAGHRLHVSVYHLSAFEDFAAISIESTPFAIDAKMVGGYAVENLLRLQGATATDLNPLIVDNQLAKLPTTACAAGEILKWAGTAWSCGTDQQGSTPGAGSETAPSLTFSNNTTTGFYSSGADQIGITVGASPIFKFSTSGLDSTSTGGARIGSAAGSLAAPTFSFAGDSDTGWYSPSADNIAATTGGTERLRIDSLGNVGIGTASPLFPLDVQNSMRLSSNSTFPISLIESGNSNTFPSILRFKGARSNGTAFPETNDAIGSIKFDTQNYAPSSSIKGLATEFHTATASGGALTFSTTPNGTNSLNERMRINNTGTVGIGTVGSAAYSLDVNGAVNLTSLSINGILFDPSSVSKALTTGSGGPALDVTQTMAGSATVPRSALRLKNLGTSPTLDFNLLGYDSASALTSGIKSNGDAAFLGRVAVGSITPARSTLDVTGTLLMKAATLNAGAIIDFSIGNIQYTNANCGAFDLHNMQDGGSYTFVVKGPLSNTCTFNTYSDNGFTVLTKHMPSDHTASTPATHTFYSLLVVGSDVYITWIPGI